MIHHCLNCRQDYDSDTQGSICPHESGERRKDRLEFTKIQIGAYADYIDTKRCLRRKVGPNGEDLDSYMQHESSDHSERERELMEAITRAIATIDGYYQGVCCCDDRYACDFCKEADKQITELRALSKVRQQMTPIWIIEMKRPTENENGWTPIPKHSFRHQKNADAWVKRWSRSRFWQYRAVQYLRSCSQSEGH